MKRYAKYKDSGVAWIGEVPSDWNVNRLGYLGTLSAGGVDKKTVEGETLVKSVHYMNVYRASLQEILNSDEYLIVSATPQKLANCTLNEGDVLFTTSSETPEDIGHSCVVGESLQNTLFGYHLMRFRPSTKMALNYQKYAFGAYYIRKWFEYRAIGMTRYGIASRDFSDATMIIPPVEAQQRIADYLDRKTAAINAVIADKQKLVELLGEKRNAVISEAVTKGLDKTAKMKDSGIEWIGKIPAHWNAKKLSYCAEVQTGPFGSQLHSEDYVEAGTPIITVEHFGEGFILHKNLPMVSDADAKRLSKYTLHENDLVFSRVGSVDRCVIVTEKEDEWLFSGRCLRVHFDEQSEIFPAYVNRFFSMKHFREYMLLVAVGATMPSINTTILNNVPMPVPPIDEQMHIVDYLDQKTAQIDALISDINEQIEKLKEYRQAVISEAVTGKVAV